MEQTGKKQQQKARPLAEIASEIVKDVNVKAARPKQITNQDAFNKAFLKELNNRIVSNSKGKSSIEITEENEWLLRVLMAYFNRNEDDAELTYTIDVKGGKKSNTLDLDKGIMLLGNFGIGKTVFFQTAFAARQKLDFGAFYTTGRKIYDCPKGDLFSLIGGDHVNLFIDDIGAEPHRQVNYGNEDTPVASVLNSRLYAWENFKEPPRMFITSNCTIDKLKELYGGRVISRLYRGCNVIISPQKSDFRMSHK